HVTEGPAYGVALMAAVGAGLYDTVAEACAATIKPMDVQQPDPAHKAIYDQYYQVYTSLYPALKERFHQVAGLVRQYQ
ncbi:MAG: xylulokinase, partial [Anaerolineae bacterium]|nr:xylulokinase [Anaerolineae bacterium]